MDSIHKTTLLKFGFGIFSLWNSFGNILESRKFIRDGCHPRDPLILGLLGQLDFIFSKSQAGRLRKFKGGSHAGEISNLKGFCRISDIVVFKIHHDQRVKS